MGDVRLTEDVFQSAFGGINETYVAVSGRNGRRVREAASELGVPKAADPRHVMTDVEYSSDHGARDVKHNDSSRCENDVAPGKHQSSIGRRVNTVGAGRSHTESHSPGGHRKWETQEATCPTAINTVVADTSAASAHAGSNVNIKGHTNNQVRGGPFYATKQQSEDVSENGWTLSQQGHQVPDSAPSTIGGLGFDEELSQATRRVKQLHMSNDRSQPLQLNRSQRTDQAMLDGEESLIDFGIKSTDSAVCTPKVGQVGGLQLKVESLIDFEIDQA